MTPLVGSVEQRRSVHDSPYRYRSIALVFVLFTLGACGGQPPMVPATPSPTVVRLVGALDQNPDARGRPSPVVVHVLLLDDVAAFEAGSFDALTTDRDVALGGSRVSGTRVTLRPGARTTVQLPGAAGPRHLGVLVEYADVLGARWRASAPLTIATRATVAPDALVFVERAAVRIESGSGSSVSPADPGGRSR